MPHIEHLSRDNDVTVVCNFSGSAQLERSLRSLGIETINLGFSRKPDFIRDFLVLGQLWWALLVSRPNLVQSFNPKAGLLASLAGLFSATKLVVHWFTGQVWVNHSGFSRLVFMWIDRLVASLNRASLVDGPAQREFLIQAKVVSADKAVVLGDGSVAGVDVDRFASSPRLRTRVRLDLGISDQDVVIVFVGRMSVEKGVQVLMEAMPRVWERYPNVKVLLVGPDEDGVVSGSEFVRRCIADGKLIHKGFSDKPHEYLNCADIFCMPSFREGFGVSALEASATGLPIICSDIYGLSDVVDGCGVTFRPGDTIQLGERIMHLVGSSKLRVSLGKAGTRKARALYPRERLISELERFYFRLLHETNY